MECFWIDSKFEFSSKRLRSNLQAKQLTTQQVGDVLCKIKLERILNVEKLIQALEELLINMKNHPAFKILIIDSIAAMMLQIQNEKIQSRKKRNLSLIRKKITEKFIFKNRSQFINKNIRSFKKASRRTSNNYINNKLCL